MSGEENYKSDHGSKFR